VVYVSNEETETILELVKFISNLLISTNNEKRTKQFHTFKIKVDYDRSLLDLCYQ